MPQLPPALVYVIIEQRFLKTAPFSNLTQLAHDEAGRSGWFAYRSSSSVLIIVCVVLSDPTADWGPNL